MPAATTAFWDASAVVPMVIPARSAALGRLLRRYRLVVWWATPLEVVSAVGRLEREDALSTEQRSRSLQRLEVLSSSWREILPVDEVRDRARELLRSYPLRTADALQLAAALVWCGGRPRRRPFVCLDLRLSEAAGEAGFEVLPGA